MSTIRIMFLGDIFGDPGRQIVNEKIPVLRHTHKPDLVFANVENASRGRGINPKHYQELLTSGIDFMTSGNHIFDAQNIYEILNLPHSKLIRPYNFSPHSPGKGFGIVMAPNGIKVGVLNVMGHRFMDPPVSRPIEAIDDVMDKLKHECDLTVLDFHAETTSEKKTVGWYCDGKIQLIVGTHTHVATADEEILPKGSAYITDLGMCGPHDSVIGLCKDVAIYRMRTGLKKPFAVATHDIRLNGIVCEINSQTKRATSIQRICERI